MKFLSVGTILGVLCIGTLFAYYLAEILAMGRGWAWIVDTFPLFLGAVIAGLIVVFTYTTIGLALSSVSKGNFFPGIALLAIVLGTKSLATIVNLMFDKETLFLISPYDCMANVGQALVGTQSNYDYHWSWSLAFLVVMNAIGLYVLSSRVASMEVTRE